MTALLYKYHCIAVCMFKCYVLCMCSSISHLSFLTGTRVAGRPVMQVSM